MVEMLGPLTASSKRIATYGELSGGGSVADQTLMGNDSGGSAVASALPIDEVLGMLHFHNLSYIYQRGMQNMLTIY